MAMHSAAGRGDYDALRRILLDLLLGRPCDVFPFVGCLACRMCLWGRFDLKRRRFRRLDSRAGDDVV